MTPFLPGDSLLFAVGAVAATGALDPLAVMRAALRRGDPRRHRQLRRSGYWIGPRVFSREDSRLLNKQHLERTHRFYEKYGGKTIIIARFVPIIRTFAPFVAGIGADDLRALPAPTT